MSDSNSSTEEKGFFGKVWDGAVEYAPYVAAAAAVGIVGVLAYNYFSEDDSSPVEEVFEAINCTDF